MKILLFSLLLLPMTSYATATCYTVTTNGVKVLLDVTSREGVLMDKYNIVNDDANNHSPEYFIWTYNSSNDKVTMLTTINKEVIALPFNKFTCYSDNNPLSNKYRPIK
jgi:hypothetical protein